MCGGTQACTRTDALLLIPIVKAYIEGEIFSYTQDGSWVPIGATAKASLHTHTWHTHTHKHAYTQTHTYAHVYMYAHAHTHMHTHMHAHIHIHVHIHIHTYTFVIYAAYKVCRIQRPASHRAGKDIVAT